MKLTIKSYQVILLLRHVLQEIGVVEDTASMVQPFTCSVSNHTSDVSSTFSS